MEERFGIPDESFDPFLLLRRKRSWWLLKNSPHVLSASRLKVSVIGMRAFRRIGRFVKPSTRMIQIFGQKAIRSRLDMDEQELQKMAAGKPLPVDLNLQNGYVILSLKGHIVGLGLLIDGMVRSQIPRRELAFLYQKERPESCT